MSINITLDQLQEVIKATVMALRGTESAPQPTTVSTTEVAQYISSRIVDFIYDPENGYTFDVWYQRYEDLIKTDGSYLDDLAQARIITSKLEQTVYAKFANYILPKKVNSLGLEDTINILRTLFGHKRSTFFRRIQCLQTERNPTDDLHTYAEIVNRRCEMFDRTNLTDDQLKCLIFVNGLKSSQDADIRTRALRYTNRSTKITKSSYRLPPTARIQKRREVSGEHTKQTPYQQKKDTPRTLNTEKRRRSFHHRHHVTVVDKITGSKTVHISRQRAINADESVTSQKYAKNKRNQIARGQNINGHPLKMQLDTGADITIISLSRRPPNSWDWTGSIAYQSYTKLSKQSAAMFPRYHLKSNGRNSPIS
uniref:Peptidase A2 domain-containing protein n=1 Tax=Heterorhabditis bacteriophora TaxID=37862 RepID=A0A1I7WEW5_HETBA